MMMMMSAAVKQRIMKIAAELLEVRRVGHAVVAELMAMEHIVHVR